MTDGPVRYTEAKRLADQAHHYTYGDGADPVTGNALATEAAARAALAQTAMLLNIAEVLDHMAGGGGHVELDAWRGVIGPACPPEPQPVKREPTGPRIYVQNRQGKQGYVLEVLHVEKDDTLWYRVQFFSPGAQPVLKRADSMTVIAATQVEPHPDNTEES